MAEQSIHDFTMKTIDGKEQPLSAYKGKTLLIVNVASKCGFTPQYKGLEALYEKYKARGLVILGFPANDFGWQEPGTDAEIKEFCSVNYGVTFPVFSKITVKGPKIHPLYQHLTEASEPAGPISWNFNKFLIGPDGRIVARWGSRTTPEDKELTGKLEQTLG
jgi:glutathione peroxidase